MTLAVAEPYLRARSALTSGKINKSSVAFYTAFHPVLNCRIRLREETPPHRDICALGHYGPHRIKTWGREIDADILNVTSSPR